MSADSNRLLPVSATRSPADASASFRGLARINPSSTEQGGWDMHLGATLRPAERLAPRGMGSPLADPRPAPAALTSTRRLPQSTWLFPALAGILSIVWVVAVLGTERAHFLVVSRPLGITLVAAITIARLTAAAVHLVFPDEKIAPALRWIGLGILLKRSAR